MVYESCTIYYIKATIAKRQFTSVYSMKLYCIVS